MISVLRNRDADGEERRSVEGCVDLGDNRVERERDDDALAFEALRVKEGATLDVARKLRDYICEAEDWSYSQFKGTASDCRSKKARARAYSMGEGDSNGRHSDDIPKSRITSWGGSRKRRRRHSRQVTVTQTPRPLGATFTQGQR